MHSAAWLEESVQDGSRQYFPVWKGDKVKTNMADKHFTSKDLVKYKDHYSEKAFWDKIRRIASKAGAKVVYYALVLFYTLTDPDTPLKYKTVIAGALGYLILPVDVLPDILPFAGLADDWAALKGTHAYDIICSFGNRVERVYCKR